MASETPLPLSDDVDVVTEKPVSRGKTKPCKVPRKIHKAEREKLKRDSLNVLFLKLSDTLEPCHDNNGKASVLTNTTRLLRDLLAQVDCLRKENTSLLSESSYVAIEKHELMDENSSLQAQVEGLKIEVQGKMHSDYAWPVIDQASQPAHVLGPFDSVSKLPTNISKPHARYPSDSWPSQILSKQQETTQHTSYGGRSREE